MMSMKYAVLVGDGMADYSIPELDGKTPLEYAATPNMDFLAKQGTIGLVSTVPQGLQPGSDVANLSLLGYEPSRYYSGRAPIEAASLGLKLSPEDTAFRCNLVTIKNETMVDYSAGHIENDEAFQLIKELDERLSTEHIKFYPGTGYRHLVVIKNFPQNLKCTPPHDITDKNTVAFLPKGDSEEIVQELMRKARLVLANSPINKARISNGKKPVTDIWLWGQGKTLSLPSLYERYSLKGSVISAVDLVRGLGILAGLQARIVQGATGYLGTNYSGKIAAAQSALETENFVYVHVEAPDETSHEGSLSKKIQAIEEFDKYIVGEMVAYMKHNPNIRILIVPDHATPLSIKTHSSEPVPFLIAGAGIEAQSNTSYCERIAQGKEVFTGPQLFEFFIRG